MRAGDEPRRARPTASASVLERGGADVDAARARAASQRAEQAGVLVGRGEDLVAGPEREPGEDAHDALAGARGQRDVGRVGAERSA